MSEHSKITASHRARAAAIYVRQSTLAQREGFESLVAEVALGQVGIILALEASRLARDNAAWYRLLDLAGACDTLVADGDGVYHPGLFNDRLVLGIKGTMAEALCGLRHKASYADVVVMPIATALLPGGGRAGEVAVGIIYSPSRKARSLSGGR